MVSLFCYTYLFATVSLRIQGCHVLRSFRGLQIRDSSAGFYASIVLTLWNCILLNGRRHHDLRQPHYYWPLSIDSHIWDHRGESLNRVADFRRLQIHLVLRGSSSRLISVKNERQRRKELAWPYFLGRTKEYLEVTKCLVVLLWKTASSWTTNKYLNSNLNSSFLGFGCRTNPTSLSLLGGDSWSAIWHSFSSAHHEKQLLSPQSQ